MVGLVFSHDVEQSTGWILSGFRTNGWVALHLNTREPRQQQQQHPPPLPLRSDQVQIVGSRVEIQEQ